MAIFSRFSDTKTGSRTSVDDGNEGKGNDPRRRRLKRRARDANKARKSGKIPHAKRMAKKVRAAIKAKRQAEK